MATSVILMVFQVRLSWLPICFFFFGGNSELGTEKVNVK